MPNNQSERVTLCVYFLSFCTSKHYNSRHYTYKILKWERYILVKLNLPENKQQSTLYMHDHYRGDSEVPVYLENKNVWR